LQNFAFFCSVGPGFSRSRAGGPQQQSGVTPSVGTRGPHGHPGVPPPFQSGGSCGA
jgi:hypothetical protein